MPLTLFHLFLGVMGCIALVLIVCSDQFLPPLSPYCKERQCEDNMIYQTVLVVGTLLWPLIWFCFVPFEKLTTCPIISLSLVWPFVIGIFQLYDSFHDKSESTLDFQQHRVVLIGGIHFDANVIISLIFAIIALFWTLSFKYGLVTKNVTGPSIKVLILALLVVVALILPTQHNSDNNQKYTSYLRAAQRIFINYCIGFILLALMVIFTNCWDNTITTQTTSTNTNTNTTNNSTLSNLFRD